MFFKVFIKQTHYLLKILHVEISDVLFEMFDFLTLFISFQILDTLLKHSLSKFMPTKHEFG